MKTCTKCGTEKEMDAFPKDKTRKDGLDLWCKGCRKIYADDHKEHSAERKKKYYEEHKERFAERAKQFRSDHKEYFAEYDKQYRKEHGEHLVESKKQYNQENKEHIAERAKQYYQEHREQRAAGHRIWAQNNPENCRLRCNKRRSLKGQAVATLTTDQWKVAKKSFNNRCAYCGKENPLQQEHFIALSKNGEYSHNNIVPACKSCNCSKWASDFLKWYPRQTFYSKRREARILQYLNYKNEVQQLAL